MKKTINLTYWSLGEAAVTSNMMTSSNGNIFRVTGPLCGEFTGRGELPAQRLVTRSFDIFFDLCLNKRLSKQPGDLRRHRAHYDIIVMIFWIIWFKIVPQMSAARPHWWLFNIGPGNGLVPSGNTPLPEPMLTKVYVAIWTLLCQC